MKELIPHYSPINIDAMFLSLYKIVEEFRNGYRICLDKDNEIFKVHFEGNPILPGACMTEISRELIEKKLNKTLTIKNIKNLKFIQIISPIESPEILITFDLNQVDNNSLQAKIQITNILNDIIFTKMSMTLQYD